MQIKLLQKRKQIKSKKPDFERQDSNRYPQFEGIWRKPKGIHSKMRRGFRGHRRMPKIGYSSPRAVKGLTSIGLKIMVVRNILDLTKITKEQIGVISSTVGSKKRLEILTKAKESSIQIKNAKDVQKEIDKIKQKIDSKKKQNKEKKEIRTKVEQKVQTEKKDNKGENANESKK